MSSAGSHHSISALRPVSGLIIRIRVPMDYSLPYVSPGVEIEYVAEVEEGSSVIFLWTFGVSVPDSTTRSVDSRSVVHHTYHQQGM